MFLAPYFTESQGRDNRTQTIVIAPEQASLFAKGIAQDFNPIHDVGAKRFVVPGDLLFALTLVRFGLRQNMSFTFSGMVGANVNLQFPHRIGDRFDLTDDNDKSYLTALTTGETSHNEALIESFIRSYVAFSGLNFTHILVPLMEQHQVMINVTRPLVIYESMAFELDRLDISGDISLELSDSTLEVQGKRGDARLNFNILADQAVVGHGFKTLVLSGLRPYDADKMQSMVDEHYRRKAAFKG